MDVGVEWVVVVGELFFLSGGVVMYLWSVSIVSNSWKLSGNCYVLFGVSLGFVGIGVFICVVR